MTHLFVCIKDAHKTTHLIFFELSGKTITNNPLIGRSDYGKACEERLMERKLNGGILNNSLTVPLIPNMASQIWNAACNVSALPSNSACDLECLISPLSRVWLLLSFLPVAFAANVKEEERRCFSPDSSKVLGHIFSYAAYRVAKRHLHWKHSFIILRAWP